MTIDPTTPTAVADASSAKALVREKYGDIARQGSTCCGSSCGCGDDVLAMDEAYANLEGYVPEADLHLGCGLPTEYAGIQPGDTVLDLGSGAGNDVFVARRIVGDEGRVVGVDMTREMIDLARQNARKLGYANVDFLLGDIEDLPLGRGTIDVAVSNCVLNLVPDKGRAFAELYRVLKPGAHFCISDIVVRGELPEALRSVAELYVGCVAGAPPIDRYLSWIAEAGFEAVEVVKQRVIDLPADLGKDVVTADAWTEFQRSGHALLSVTVRGVKPTTAD